MGEAVSTVTGFNVRVSLEGTLGPFLDVDDQYTASVFDSHDRCIRDHLEPLNI
jgi:hypothetical protein